MLKKYVNVQNVILLSLFLSLIACNSDISSPTDTKGKEQNNPLYPEHYKEVSFLDTNEIDKDIASLFVNPATVSDNQKLVLIRLINKWHSNLFSGSFEFLPYLCKAGTIDYATVTYSIPGFDNLDTSGLKILNSWAGTNISHIQNEPIYANEPGNTPWGSVNSVPTYKKMLPSEMRGIKLYTNKISGECTSIAIVLLSVLRNNLVIVVNA